MTSELKTLTEGETDGGDRSGSTVKRGRNEAGTDEKAVPMAE